MNITIHGQNADDLMAQVKKAAEFSETEIAQFTKLHVSLSMNIQEFIIFHRAIKQLHDASCIAEQIMNQPIPPGLTDMYDEINDIENITIKGLKVVKD